MSRFDVVQVLGAGPGTPGLSSLVVTAKPVTTLGHKILNADPSHAIPVIRMAGFNTTGFMAEVRTAVPPGGSVRWSRC